MSTNVRKAWNPFEEAKKQRLAWLQDFLKGSEFPIKYNKLVALMETRYGITAKTARAYIRTATINMDLSIQEGDIVRLEA